MESYAPAALVISGQQWSSGLCECCSDAEVCLDAWCCPACSIARQWDAVEGRMDSMNSIVFCANCCLGAGLITNCFLRCNVARVFSVDEGSCQSCCIATFLPLCSIAQTHRQLLSFGRYPGGCCANDPPQIAYAQAVVPPAAMDVDDVRHPIAAHHQGTYSAV